MSIFLSRIQESEKIYHSCLNKKKDGSNTLFEKGDLCCTPTNSPFWERPSDVTSGARTCSQEKQQKKVDVEEFNRYFQNLWNIQRWLEASDSEVEILNEPYEFYVVDNA